MDHSFSSPCRVGSAQAAGFNFASVAQHLSPLATRALSPIPLPKAWTSCLASFSPQAESRQWPPLDEKALCLSDLMGCSHTHARLLSRWAIPRNNFFNTGSVLIKMATEILMFVMFLRNSKLKLYLPGTLTTSTAPWLSCHHVYPRTYSHPLLPHPLQHLDYNTFSFLSRGFARQ